MWSVSPTVDIFVSDLEATKKKKKVNKVNITHLQKISHIYNMVKNEVNFR